MSSDNTSCGNRKPVLSLPDRKNEEERRRARNMSSLYLIEDIGEMQANGLNLSGWCQKHTTKFTEWCNHGSGWRNRSGQNVTSVWDRRQAAGIVQVKLAEHLIRDNEWSGTCNELYSSISVYFSPALSEEDEEILGGRRRWNETNLH